MAPRPWLAPDSHPLVILPLLPLLLRLKSDALLSFRASPWGEPDGPECSQGNPNSVPQERGFHTAHPGQLNPDSSPLPRDRRGVAPRCLRSSAHSLYLYDGVGNGVLSEYRLLTDLKTKQMGGTGAHSQAFLICTQSPFCSSTAHRTASGTGTCPAPVGPCPAVMTIGGYALSLDRKVWEMEIPTASDGHCCSHHHLPPSWSEMVWLHLEEEKGFDTCCSNSGPGAT